MKSLYQHMLSPHPIVTTRIAWKTELQWITAEEKMNRIHLQKFYIAQEHIVLEEDMKNVKDT